MRSGDDGSFWNGNKHSWHSNSKPSLYHNCASSVKVFDFNDDVRTNCGLLHLLFVNSISCSSKELNFSSLGVKLTSAQGLTLPKSQAQWASSCYNCPRAHTLRVELPQVPKINSGSILTATASIVILARAKDGIFTLQFTKFLRAAGVRLHGIDKADDVNMVYWCRVCLSGQKL